jgi:hypothetical protein
VLRVDLYYLTALLIVVAIPLAAIATLVGLTTWARDALRRAPVVGGLGIVFVLAALVNLFVARTCGAGTNRPIIALTLADEACHRVGLVSLEIVLLLVVTTAVMVRLSDVRR